LSIFEIAEEILYEPMFPRAVNGVERVALLSGMNIIGSKGKQTG
jgi:hypothetical protein